MFKPKLDVKMVTLKTILRLRICLLMLENIIETVVFILGKQIAS